MLVPWTHGGLMWRTRSVHVTCACTCACACNMHMHMHMHMHMQCNMHMTCHAHAHVHVHVHVYVHVHVARKRTRSAHAAHTQRTRSAHAAHTQRTRLVVDATEEEAIEAHLRAEQRRLVQARITHGCSQTRGSSLWCLGLQPSAPRHLRGRVAEGVDLPADGRRHLDR